MELTRCTLLDRLYGKHIHIEPIEALKKITTTDSALIPFLGGRSMGELLFHMNWWQDFSLSLINGVIGPFKDGMDWPTDDVDWEELVERFVVGLGELRDIVKNRDLDYEISIGDEVTTTVGAEVLGVSQHTSYHLGQVVSACKALGIWK